jgi:hypothetical protein
MDRRETLKSLLIGGVAGASLTATGCKGGSIDEVVDDVITGNGYGRTPSEQEHDRKLNSEDYFNEHELTSIAVLCDIILPKKGNLGSATDAGVPDFIEFIVKDLPNNQLPMRGGLAWLDGESNKRYDNRFVDLSDTQQIAIIDDIAYPDPDGERPDLGPGIKFFTQIRNLTLTGYYTTKMGFDDLGYVGNRPNIWDGVPADVLADHDVDYDPEWIAKCIDQDTREAVAEWDADGKLLN